LLRVLNGLPRVSSSNYSRIDEGFGALGGLAFASNLGEVNFFIEK